MDNNTNDLLNEFEDFFDESELQGQPSQKKQPSENELPNLKKSNIPKVEVVQNKKAEDISSSDMPPPPMPEVSPSEQQEAPLPLPTDDFQELSSEAVDIPLEVKGMPEKTPELNQSSLSSLTQVAERTETLPKTQSPQQVQSQSLPQATQQIQNVAKSDFPEPSLPLHNEAVSVKDEPLPELPEKIGVDLPTFDSDESLDGGLEVPTPPPELRARTQPHLRLQDIEDEYLTFVETQADMDDIRQELAEEKLMKRPVFVNVEEYGKLLELLRGTKNNFRIFSDTRTRINRLSAAQTSTLSKMNKLFEDLQRKIIMIDNALFEEEE